MPSLQAPAEPQLARRAVERMSGGDTSALGDLYDAHAQNVYRLALRMLRDRADAEDIVQEVFTQAWRQASRYDATRATVIGWLLMMTRTRALDRLRARQARADRTVPTALAEIPIAEPGQDVVALTAEAASRVREALRGLGESLRTPIELAYYEGLSQSDIAERLGQPLGTVKTRMRTAMMRLRQVLRTEGV